MLIIHPREKRYGADHPNTSLHLTLLIGLHGVARLISDITLLVSLVLKPEGNL